MTTNKESGYYDYQICPNCSGSGEAANGAVGAGRCWRCGGTGEDRVWIEVPATAPDEADAASDDAFGDEAAAIMRKEPEPPTVKESLTVPVVKQSLTTEPISDAEIIAIRKASFVSQATKPWEDTLSFARALLEKAR